MTQGEIYEALVVARGLIEEHDWVRGTYKTQTIAGPAYCAMGFIGMATTGEAVRETPRVRAVADEVLLTLQQEFGFRYGSVIDWNDGHCRGKDHLLEVIDATIRRLAPDPEETQELATIELKSLKTLALAATFAAIWI